ncbi:DUF6087 family protein [Streptomyces sp. NPDC101062]|uniref:DUF6087 family protein n=1 Tax=unclassified Streptomyces TaxID=2593676 RepID=UPI003817FF60
MLEAWIARRESRAGVLRAHPITPLGVPRGAHVAPDTPRLIERWTGLAWEVHGVAENHGAAQRLLRSTTAGTGSLPSNPQAGKPTTGRHRKPPTTPGNHPRKESPP